VTADPPRKLPPGDHFDLARDVSDALENKIAFEHRDSLHGHLFPDDLGRIAGAFDAAAENTADGPGRAGCPV
jgi:hypothetical protein